MASTSRLIALTVTPGRSCKIAMPNCSAMELKHAALAPAVASASQSERCTLECTLATRSFVLCSLPPGRMQASLGTVVTNDPDETAWLFLKATGPRAVHVFGRLIISSRGGSGDGQGNRTSTSKRRIAGPDGPDAVLDDKPSKCRRRTSVDRATPLFTMRETLRCALAECIVCRAKILVNVGERSVPSARPETCPRIARPRSATAVVASIGLYRRGQRILTVGDGDFTFSLALARALGGQTIVASSHESLASLQGVYGPSCLAALDELRALGAVVAHGVDAADLAGTLPASAFAASGCAPPEPLERRTRRRCCCVACAVCNAHAVMGCLLGTASGRPSPGCQVA